MYESLKHDLTVIVRETHEAVLKVYQTSFDVDQKTDSTPITEADRRSHDIIHAGLTRLDRTMPILSEESELASFSTRQSWDRYWLIDPLDGTKEFVKRNGEFTVNIALVVANQSVIGMVGRPTTGEIYWGNVEQSEALRIHENGEQTIRTRQIETGRVVSVQSRRRPDPAAERFLERLESEIGQLERLHHGSSLKFLSIAAAEADFYLQPGGTSEWDTAAAHAVLVAAGGDVMTLTGGSLIYNIKEHVLNEPFIALGDVSEEWRNKLIDLLGVFSV